MTTHSTAVGASLERAYRHWRERGALLALPTPGGTQLPMTIAVSRQRGAGGAAIASQVAKKLDWPLYDRQLVDQIAEDSGYRSQLLEDLDEKRPNWLAECIEGFSEEKHMSGVGFAIRLKKVLLALYCHGECVVLGRGAAQLMPSEKTLRVLLVAPEEYRVARIASTLGMSEAEALDHVGSADRDRVDFVKSYFHRDPTDPGSYDITMNTSRFSENMCCELILSALQGRREQIAKG